MPNVDYVVSRPNLQTMLMMRVRVATTSGLYAGPTKNEGAWVILRRISGEAGLGDTLGADRFDQKPGRPTHIWNVTTYNSLMMDIEGYGLTEEDAMVWLRKQSPGDSLSIF